MRKCIVLQFCWTWTTKFMDLTSKAGFRIIIYCRIPDLPCRIVFDFYVNKGINCFFMLYGFTFQIFRWRKQKLYWNLLFGKLSHCWQLCIFILDGNKTQDHDIVTNKNKFQKLNTTFCMYDDDICVERWLRLWIWLIEKIAETLTKLKSWLPILNENLIHLIFLNEYFKWISSTFSKVNRIEINDKNTVMRWFKLGAALILSLC